MGGCVRGVFMPRSRVVLKYNVQPWPRHVGGLMTRLAVSSGPQRLAGESSAAAVFPPQAAGLDRQRHGQSRTPAPHGSNPPSSPPEARRSLARLEYLPFRARL